MRLTFRHIAFAWPLQSISARCFNMVGSYALQVLGGVGCLVYAAVEATLHLNLNLNLNLNNSLYAARDYSYVAHDSVCFARRVFCVPCGHVSA